MEDQEDYQIGFEPTQDLSEDFFGFVSDFEEKYASVIHKVFHMVVKAGDREMWYDFDHNTLISSSEFDWMLKKGLVGQYSGNSSHPVFGDLSKYVDEIGPKLVNYSNDLRIIGAKVATILKTDLGTKSSILLANSLKDVSIDLIFNLRYSHPDMPLYWQNSSFWNELIRNEQKKQGLPVLMPLVQDLEPIYYGMRREYGSVIVKEHISKQTRAEGRAIIIAEQYDLVDEDMVVLFFEDEEMYRFRIFRSKDAIELRRPEHE
jgi:hypothetical protein